MFVLSYFCFIYLLCIIKSLLIDTLDKNYIRNLLYTNATDHCRIPVKATVLRTTKKNKKYCVHALKHRCIASLWSAVHPTKLCAHKDTVQVCDHIYETSIIFFFVRVNSPYRTSVRASIAVRNVQTREHTKRKVHDEASTRDVCWNMNIKHRRMRKRYECDMAECNVFRKMRFVVRWTSNVCLHGEAASCVYVLVLFVKREPDSCAFNIDELTYRIRVDRCVCPNQ